MTARTAEFQQEVADTIRDNPSMSYRDVGRRFGITRQYVGNIAARYGVSRPAPEIERDQSECPVCGVTFVGRGDTCSAPTCRKAWNEHNRVSGSRGQQAYELRCQGLTWREVAWKAGYAHLSAGIRAAQRYAEVMRFPWPPSGVDGRKAS